MTNNINEITFDLIPMYVSFKRDYGYRLRADYYGFHMRDAYNNTVYKDGEYRGEVYNGPDAGQVYRERVIRLLQWALVNAPTTEVHEFERYVRELFKPKYH